MYRIFFINFGYYSQESFSTVDDAVDYGKDKGFEFAVYDKEGNIVAAKTGFNGVRKYK